MDQDTFHSVETGPSKAAHAHEAWDPEWISKRFVGLLRCQDANCGELVSVSGDAGMTFYQDDRGDLVYEDVFRPTAICPALEVFSIPGSCPDEVGQALQQSFGLLWNDTEAAANRLRSAIEALLTEQGVPRNTVNAKGKRQPLSLHSRIEKYQAKNEDAAELLMAIKWFGNAGSHTVGGVDRATLLDAYELLEHAIEIIYVRRTAALKKIAKSMTARKGRPARVKRRP
jgi:hypothetical protein